MLISAATEYVTLHTFASVTLFGSAHLPGDHDPVITVVLPGTVTTTLSSTPFWLANVTVCDAESLLAMTTSVIILAAIGTRLYVAAACNAMVCVTDVIFGVITVNAASAIVFLLLPSQ